MRTISFSTIGSKQKKKFCGCSRKGLVKPGVAEVRVSCAIVAAMDVVAYVVDMVVGSFWCCVLMLHFDTRMHKKTVKQTHSHCDRVNSCIQANRTATRCLCCCWLALLPDSEC